MRLRAMILGLLIAVAFLATAQSSVAGTLNVRLISVTPSGYAGDGASTGPKITPDGRYIAFVSVANDLVPGDTEGHSDAFVYDTQTSTMERVSVNSMGQGANFGVNGVDISDDGRYVLIASQSSNLVTPTQPCLLPPPNDNCGRLFIHDRQANTNTQVSLNSAGQQADHDADYYRLSGNGRFVFFESHSANLGLPTDTHQNDNRSWVRDLVAGTTELVNIMPNGDRSFGQMSWISTDGRYVSWNLTDAYLRDRQTQTTIVVKSNADAGPVTDDGQFMFLSNTRVIDIATHTESTVPGIPYEFPAQDISPNGRFETSLGYSGPPDYKLFATIIDRDSDVDGIFDESGAVTNTTVSVSPGGSELLADKLSLSDDGRFVAFQTSDCRQALHDQNNGRGVKPSDVYVADLNAATSAPSDEDCDDVASPPDNCPNTANANQLNQDGDTLGNACDNCPTTTNEDQANQDGDPFGDACEQPQCVNVATAWQSPSPDDNDCDGFPDTTPSGGFASEASIGTQGGVRCAATSVPNDEAGPDAWPPDFNDDQLAGTADVIKFGPVFNKHNTDAGYNERFNLNGDSLIGVQDVIKMGPFFNKRCT